MCWAREESANTAHAYAWAMIEAFAGVGTGVLALFKAAARCWSGMGEGSIMVNIQKATGFALTSLQ
jgi:hypothetical protein